MNVTIKYGMGNVIDLPLAEVPNVGAALRHAGARQELGYGDNVEARIGGITVDAGYTLSGGEVIDLQTKANSKA